MTRRMVFEAQDPNRIVDLDHLVVLISSAPTASINRMRVLINDLCGDWLIRGTNSAGGSLNRVFGGALNSVIISLVTSPRKGRSYSGCLHQKLYINVWTLLS